ncbi:response regulator FixJ [Pseudochelatococcus contaminans]|uniref:Two-component system response regulator FixJ n=1 Tax=Pseudochelatococcus contaminans TaxID=1538103 RepID=A0A7W5Z1W2_9HYPH|nr:response regulator FixJ [Pseudochelatococcus contaminans]MBB3808555.1 two-component system response regulator FixJ [Pseudochelatococcus contaminans]
MHSGPVHVIDDDESVRDSLSFLLGGMNLTVLTYSSAETFLEQRPWGLGGCIVSDVRMPGMSGIDLLRTLKERGIGLPLIVITGNADIPLAVEAMKAGASDFLEKPFDDEVLLAAIEKALGTHPKTSHVNADTIEVNQRLQSLTTREREVLDCLVTGLSNKNIASELGISPRTVEVHRAHVMTKMNATSLSHLIRMALVGGIDIRNRAIL